MTEKEAFEADYRDHIVFTGIYHHVSRVDCYPLWQACADRKNKTIAGLHKKLRALAPEGTCCCCLPDEQNVCLHHSPHIVELRAELEALRGFVNSMREYQDNVIMSAVIRECLAFNLIDENGNPTSLLTGESK